MLGRLSFRDLWQGATAVATVGILACVIGCGASKAETPPQPAEKDNAKLYELPKAVPSSLEQGRLRLLHQGHALYVGDDQSRIFDIFGPPPGASDVADLPEGWDQDHYRVKGWEKGKDAFGAIIVKDNVALAMFTS